MEEFRSDRWHTNLNGTFIVNQAAGRIMKGQTPDSRGERGCLVNIASLNSYISLTEVLAYASSKSGVLGIIRGLANEWAQYGIRVNGIAPGVFPTDLNRKLIEGTHLRAVTEGAHAGGAVWEGGGVGGGGDLSDESVGQLYQWAYDHCRWRIYCARRGDLWNDER